MFENYSAVPITYNWSSFQGVHAAKYTLKMKLSAFWSYNPNADITYLVLQTRLEELR